MYTNSVQNWLRIKLVTNRANRKLFYLMIEIAVINNVDQSRIVGPV